MVFSEAIKQAPSDKEVYAFRELYDMNFGDHDLNQISHLIANNQLWVVCLVMRRRYEYDQAGNLLIINDNERLERFGPGLFNRKKTYDSQTSTVHALRDAFHDENLFYFVVKGEDVDKVVSEFEAAVNDTPQYPFGSFFNKHPGSPFIRKGDYVAANARPDVKPETSMAFRDDYYYNVFVTYAHIAEHELEMMACNHGDYFEADIKVAAISGEDNKFMAFIDLPSEIKRPQVNSLIMLRFQDQLPDEDPVPDPNVAQEPVVNRPKNTDVWFARVVNPAPCAPATMTTVIMDRPFHESPNARQPDILKTSDEPTDRLAIMRAPDEKVECMIPVSTKQFDQLLGCILGLQHPSNAEMHQVLLAGNLMDAPHINFWEGVKKEDIDHAQSHSRIYPDIEQIFDGLYDTSKIFTVEGAAGTGKSHVLSLLTLLHATREKYMYPFHPKGYDGKWLPTFESHYESTRRTGEVPEKTEESTDQSVDASGETQEPWDPEDDERPSQTPKSSKMTPKPPLEPRLVTPQSVIVCPTNNSVDDNLGKIERLAKKIFPDKPLMLIRLHSLSSEMIIAERSYTHPQTRPDPVNQPRGDRTPDNDNPENPTEEELACNGIIAHLDSVKAHFDNSHSSTQFSTEGIRDHRVQHLEWSLGTRMLEIAGIIEGSPFAAPESRYPMIRRLYNERLRGQLEPTEEKAFKKDIKRLLRDTLGTAHVVVATPSAFAQSTVYHNLHPSFVAIDEATMIRETDLLPVLCYLFPVAFGLFGDSRQLGPTVTSTAHENPYHRQLKISLLNRMVDAGLGVGQLNVQRRLTGHIHKLVNTIFYNKRLRWDFPRHTDPNEKSKTFADHNKQEYNVNSNVVFLAHRHGEERQVQSSYANSAHCTTAFDVVFKIHESLEIPLEDIVILTGYDAQWRSYIEETDRRKSSHPSVDWQQVKVHKIETFQGNESDVVIFDMVRTRSMGFMRHFQRLNVALSRGRYALYVIYNRQVMHEDPFAKSPFLEALMNFAKTNRLVHTVPEPLVQLFPDIPTRTDRIRKLQKPNDSHDQRRAERKANTERPVYPRHSLASIEPEQTSTTGFESTGPEVDGGW